MTPAKVAHTTKILNAAAFKLSALLSVPYSTSPLYAHRECYLVSTLSGRDVCVQYRDVTTCGLGADELTIPFLPQLFGSDVVYSRATAQPTTLAASTGVPGANFGVFVTAIKTSVCTSELLAYAVSCQRDANTDRPTWARINICPDSLNVNVDAYHAQVATVVHELVHALGFSSDSFALFRDANGAPRTPRNSADTTYPAPQFFSQFSCAGFKDGYGDYFASPNTIAFSPERGMQCKWAADGETAGVTASSWLPRIDGKTSVNDCVARVNTPAAVAASRDYFGCATLGGPELENVNEGCSLYGSHWEERVLSGELMASYISHYPMLSSLTAAFFADSGWYKVNFGAADGTRAGARSETGFKQGCAYAGERCSNTNGGTPPAWSLDPAGRAISSGTAMCTGDMRSIGFTSVASFASKLPAQYQYFGSPTTGGSVAAADYCPMVWSYGDGMCSVASNAWGLPAIVAEKSGETYGTTSLCLTTSLRSVSGSFSPRGAGCYALSCSDTGGVTIVLGSGQRLICAADGDVKSATGYDGTIVCPSAAAVCGAPTRADALALAALAAAVSPSPSPAPITAAGGAVRLALFFKLPTLTSGSFSAAAVQTALAAAVSAGIGGGTVVATGAVPVYLDEDAGLGRRAESGFKDDVLVARVRNLVMRRGLDALPASSSVRRTLSVSRTAAGVSAMFTIDAAPLQAAGKLGLTTSSSLTAVALAVDKAVKAGLVSGGSIVSSTSWSSVASLLSTSASILSAAASIDATRPTSSAGGPPVGQVKSIESMIGSDPTLTGTTGGGSGGGLSANSSTNTVFSGNNPIVIGIVAAIFAVSVLFALVRSMLRSKFCANRIAGTGNSIVAATASPTLPVAMYAQDYPGMQGNPGYPGMQGNPGYPAMQGNPGYPAMQGNPGYPGMQGNPGYPGMQGNPGYPGMQGNPGYPGMQGNPGYPGMQGNPGGYPVGMAIRSSP